MKNKNYIAAVSGGPDSMAMLDKYIKKIQVIAHVNYHKRSDSNIDTKIVKDYCLTNNLILEVLDVTPEMYLDNDNNNFQHIARMIRYNFFLKISKKYNLSNILIAHNLDDFIETATMQKNRGSKNFFLGIKKISYFDDLKIYRPLINVSKKKLLDYCNKKNIKYAIDSSNDSEIYERNVVRKGFSQYNHLQKKMLKLKYDFYNFYFKPVLKKTIHKFEVWKKSSYSWKLFASFNSAYQTYLIYFFLKHNNFDKISLAKINLIIDFINNGEVHKKLRLKNNIFLIKNIDSMSLEKIEKE